jgi:hypothetical protein
MYTQAVHNVRTTRRARELAQPLQSVTLSHNNILPVDYYKLSGGREVVVWCSYSYTAWKPCAC